MRVMPRKKSDPLKQMEEAQNLLRDNIEQSRQLIEKSEKLLEKHRKELKKGEKS
jgi:hypothetical protein